jgi:hypothetical protein
MIFSTLQSSPWGRQNFLAKRLVTHQWMTAAFIASNGGCRYAPFRPNCMSIPAITRERKGAKPSLPSTGRKPREIHLLPELKGLRKD